MLLIDAPGEAEEDPVLRDLKGLPLDGMSPLDALLKLYELQRRAMDRGGK
jgi:hypothetical protein